MSQERLRALNESRTYFESGGMTADVEAIDEKIAAVEAELEAAKPAEKSAAKKPAAKKAAVKKTTTKVEEVITVANPETPPVEAKEK